MKAGRELNEAVAKEVLGWTEKEGSPGVWRMHKVGEGTLEGHLPEFSTSQSDVKAVRRAIGDMNLGSTFQKQLEKATGWYGDKTLGASPEQICQAAIASVREK